MPERSLETRRGIKCRVRESGRGAPLVFLHGAGGLFPQEPLLDALAERFQVFAPVWPGFGAEAGEELLEDMLDFALHGWDLLEALGLERPVLVGHSLGGMIAAEMAALNSPGIEKLVLLAPAGVWLDAHPIPDMFAMTPFELPAYLFADAQAGEKLLTAGLDLTNNEALRAFMVGNARRLGTAGKLLFPVPNRRFSKRAYRVSAKTLIGWGEQDRLIPPLYADAWQRLIAGAEIRRFDDAGHMLTLEQPRAVANAIASFVA